MNDGSVPLFGPVKPCQWASMDNRSFHTCWLVKAGNTKMGLLTILLALFHMDAPVSHAIVQHTQCQGPGTGAAISYFVLFFLPLHLKMSAVSCIHFNIPYLWSPFSSLTDRMCLFRCVQCESLVNPTELKKMPKTIYINYTLISKCSFQGQKEKHDWNNFQGKAQYWRSAVTVFLRMFQLTGMVIVNWAVWGFLENVQYIL